jgi:hypothetical protein
MQAEILVLYDPDRSQAVIDQHMGVFSRISYGPRAGVEKRSWSWAVCVDATRDVANFCRPNAAAAVEISGREVA